MIIKQILLRYLTQPLNQRRLFCCGSLLPVFGVRVSVKFHLAHVLIIFSSVWVAAGWPHFGK